MGSEAVFFDIDGTWLRWQLFDEWIHKMVELGLLPGIVLAKTEEQRRAYKRREGSFDDFVNAQIDAYQNDFRLRGVRLSDARFAAREVIRENGRLVHVFTDRLSQAVEELGIRRVIISGSPREVVTAFAESHRITDIFATEHPSDTTTYLGGMPIEWCFKKGEAVRILAEEARLSLERSVAIGDSGSDAEMFEQVGYPICFNPSAKLLALARNKRWPVVWEKKDVLAFFRCNDQGLFQETSLLSILPPEIAERLASKLKAV
ncbi:HAD-IB family phosphatase [Candidatus Uhrbacteria bacterium]|nr:HAD-IB family phosphatase [Candidatus Uhrbacteria bacterium]